MGKKKKFIPKRFESDSRAGDVSANIYVSMLMSRAWQELTNRQKALYLCCKAQYYNRDTNVKTGFSEQFINNRDYFVFPQHLWFKDSGKTDIPDSSLKSHNLYSNKKSFYHDMSALIGHGFIDCVECGADLRKKTLYQFSDRWHDYGKSGYVVPENVKTISMQNTRKKTKTRNQKEEFRIESKEIVR